MNDVIDLHQNAVGELRGQLSQVESASVGKTHDLEDLLHENQSKVGVVLGVGVVLRVSVVIGVGVVCGGVVIVVGVVLKVAMALVVGVVLECVQLFLVRKNVNLFIIEICKGGVYHSLLTFITWRVELITIIKLLVQTLLMTNVYIAIVVSTPPQMEKLESLIHREIERKAEMEKARNWVMTFVAWAVTFVLHLIAFVLKLSSLLR